MGFHLRRISETFRTVGALELRLFSALIVGVTFQMVFVSVALGTDFALEIVHSGSCPLRFKSCNIINIQLVVCLSLHMPTLGNKRVM